MCVFVFVIFFSLVVLCWLCCASSFALCFHLLCCCFLCNYFFLLLSLLLLAFIHTHTRSPHNWMTDNFYKHYHPATILESVLLHTGVFKTSIFARSGVKNFLLFFFSSTLCRVIGSISCCFFFAVFSIKRFSPSFLVDRVCVCVRVRASEWYPCPVKARKVPVFPVKFHTTHHRLRSQRKLRKLTAHET